MTTNSLLVSTLIVAIAGIVALNIKSIISFISEFLLNYIFHSIKIEESSDFFYAFQNYVMSEKSDKVKNFYYRNLYDNFIGGNDENERNMFFNYGYFFLKTEEGIVFISKINETISNTMTPYKNTKQSIKIYALSSKPILNLISTIERIYVNSKIRYYFNNDGEIRLLGSVPPKTFNHIFLNDGIVDTLKADLDTFERSSEHYKKLGIKYKRTYLFYGVAGTGKSSLSTAIANYTMRNIMSINISKDMTDATLIKLIANRPKKTIILFEDIDCLFDIINREVPAEDNKTKEERTSHITLSCLLNVLDGSYTPENVIFILTTNHIDKLDEAIKRDGRTDMLIHIDKPNLDTKKKYLEYLKNNGKFVENVNLDGNFTLSTLEKHLLK